MIDEVRSWAREHARASSSEAMMVDEPGAEFGEQIRVDGQVIDAVGIGADHVIMLFSQGEVVRRLDR